MCKMPSTKFVLDRPPREDESLNGLILRIAGANHVQKLVWLEALLEISVPRAAREDGRLERLSELTGLPLDDLEHRQYKSDSEGYLRYFECGSVHPYRIRSTEFRYCPGCVGADPYHRAIWDLDLIVACPRHRIYLIDSDPESDKLIGWRRTDLLAAAIGDLPVQDNFDEQRDVLPAHEVRGQEAIAQFVSGNRDGRLAAIGDIVRSWCLNDFLDLLVFLGGEFGQNVKLSGTKRTRVGSEKVLELTNVGYDFLVDWPKRLYGELERIRAESTASGTGLGRIFESLFKRMRKMGDGGAKKVLQDAFRDYLLERPIPFNPKNAQFVRGDDRVGWKYVTLQQVGRILGVTPYAARQIALEQKWIEPGKTSRNTPNIIPRSFVEAYNAPEKTNYNKEEAMNALGISKTALPAFEKHGLLNRKSDNEDGRASYVFSKFEVHRLLDELRARVQTGESDQEPIRLIGLSDLHQAMVPATVTLGGLCSLVLAGKLVPRGWDEAQPGVRGMMFQEHQLDEMRGHALLLRKPWLPGRAAMSRIGYLGDELALLVSCKIVRLVRWNGSLFTSTFSVEELINAKINYAFDREVSERSGHKFEFVASNELGTQLYRRVG